MTNLNQMLQFSNKVKELEWTEIELLNMPEKYTNLMVHIALELADNDKDEKHFYGILNGDKCNNRKSMLIKHIQYTLGIFSWNFEAT